VAFRAGGASGAASAPARALGRGRARSRSARAPPPACARSCARPGGSAAVPVAPRRARRRREQAGARPSPRASSTCGRGSRRTRSGRCGRRAWSPPRRTARRESGRSCGSDPLPVVRRGRIKPARNANWCQTPFGETVCCQGLIAPKLRHFLRSDGRSALPSGATGETRHVPCRGCRAA
jgi:hypothetical protein